MTRAIYWYIGISIYLGIGCPMSNMANRWICHAFDMVKLIFSNFLKILPYKVKKYLYGWSNRPDPLLDSRLTTIYTLNGIKQNFIARYMTVNATSAIMNIFVGLRPGRSVFFLGRISICFKFENVCQKYWLSSMWWNKSIAVNVNTSFGIAFLA